MLALTPALEAGPQPDTVIKGGLYQSTIPLERVVLSRTLYAGDCPGTSLLLQPGISLRSEWPPCELCRVRITNTRTGGYSDREYKPGRAGSEPFAINLGSGHHGQYLSLEEGTNPLHFAIRQKNQILAEGGFNLDVVVESRRQERNFSSRILDTYCDEERTWSLQRRTPLSQCRYAIVSQLRGLCPDGSERVLLEKRQTIWRRN